MLEKIRDGSQGVIAQVVLGLVILTFAVSGVSSYFGNNADQPVAVVNGEEISRTKFEQSYQNERARMEQQFGEMFANLAADTNYMNNFRNQVLERLIDETLLKQQSTVFGIAISDQFLKEALLKMPEFQVDGAFNNDRYLAVLRQSNLTANQLRDLLREQYSRNQLLVGLAGSDFALPGEMKSLMTLQQQTRDIEYAKVKATDLAKDVKFDDAQLNTWYQQNQARYATPEQLSLQYVELNAANLAKDIQVNDDDINAYYNANLSRYQGEERRRVSHILLESTEDNTDVKTKAEGILKELQGGADFAALAKQHSADTVSAENGGDLDFITKGVMEPEFETAAYALAKAGDLSAVVKTSFGYHIIKLTEVEAAKVKTIDEVKDSIVAAVKTEKSAEKFAELQQKLAEVSFEVADNLEEAATAVGAKVQTAAMFSRATAPGVLNTPKFLDTVFNADFISAGTNSEVVELAPQHVVVARLVEHQPAKNKSFDEVKAEVQAAYIVEQSAELAQQKAAALLTELQAGKAISELVAANGLTLEKSVATPRFGGALDAEVRTKAFELAKPTKDKTVSFGSTKLQSGDAALVLVSKVTDVPSQGEPAQAELDNLANQLSQSHFAIVQKALRERSEISRNLAVLTAATEQQ